ncbi:DNA replication/repair protein RecF [Bifidobacterium olomucense]|uniref:DNA replication and repair protein RecF n=1 Tax=Bifidobacterium olomucense TaxID=2675324 RepID=A0A7Y0HW53_9BIFI|nr:DNA replication/repair protein RecF [Bifidobacterium sp. DSM 109959]NMM98850.1 DNA recombination and repair protein RecF [Bifidobacterium sp. DSM 109959]
MYISRLALDHYRSWSQVVVDFVPGVNILVGRNGLGKTNLVEAVEVLSTGTSHRVSSTLPLIERGQPTATIRANVMDGRADGNAAGDADDRATEQATTYEASIHARGANRARVNSGSSVYLRDIVGSIPSVAFTPEDQRLVSGDPASRRGFLNQAAALLEPDYMATLQQLTRIGRQRAALLKQLGAAANTGQPMDAALSGLEIWTGQFIETGVALTRMRNRVVDRLAGPFSAIYADLAGGGEPVRLTYAPSFDEVLLYGDDPHPHISEHFQRIYPGEVARGVNLIGPQRDDLELTLSGCPAREFASNGEMWTMALALKMALFRVVRETLAINPIVILDDVFAQLDDHRRTQILEFAGRQDQVLITTASLGDVPALPSREKAHVIDVGALAGVRDGNVAGASGIGTASSSTDAGADAAFAEAMAAVVRARQRRSEERS